MPTGKYKRTKKEIERLQKLGRDFGFKKGHSFLKGGEKGWVKKGQHLSPKTEFTTKSISGEKNYWYGKKGELSSNWQGGIWHNPYPEKWVLPLKRKVRKRDNYICQLCGQRENPTFSVHHFNYDKQNCNLDNLITLCRNCNSKVNFKRKEWMFLFLDKASKQKLNINFENLLGLFKGFKTYQDWEAAKYDQQAC